MRHQIVGLITAIAMGGLFAVPAVAEAKQGSCVAVDNGSLPAQDAASCRGGPLGPGDPRLGNAKIPQTANRETPPKHSFDIGGTSVTVSGSIRVDGVYAK
ncbi:hypothetical protein [Pseudochelatococcus sp. G4_1912]|uniref:hypothetical protein n=1 Tax=Pseudochelatococcus sp. G4_1912 TaxID=3114288 RepID=UPI0039C74564